MDQQAWLATTFESARPHLTGVAQRMLGSAGEADDAVQEAWMRLTRSDASSILNLRGWLTTVVARVCLDKLRSPSSRHDEPLDALSADLTSDGSDRPDAALLMADEVGPALLVVVDVLTPAERIAFVLHDLFDVSFADIAPIIERTEDAARQLASRARRRVRGASPPAATSPSQQDVVAAFLAASRDGNFNQLIRLLHPDVVCRADETAIAITRANQAKGAPAFAHAITGAAQVAETFTGRAAAAQLARVDGVVGATWAPGGRPVVVFRFSLDGGVIAGIEVIMDRAALDRLDVDIITPTGRPSP